MARYKCYKYCIVLYCIVREGIDDLIVWSLSIIFIALDFWLLLKAEIHGDEKNSVAISLMYCSKIG